MSEEKPDKEKKNLIARQKKDYSDHCFKNKETEPSLYYASTSEIARRVLKCIQDKEYINHQQFELVESLSADDIQVILFL